MHIKFMTNKNVREEQRRERERHILMLDNIHVHKTFFLVDLLIDLHHFCGIPSMKKCIQNSEHATGKMFKENKSYLLRVWVEWTCGSKNKSWTCYLYVLHRWYIKHNWEIKWYEFKCSHPGTRCCCCFLSLFSNKCCYFCEHVFNLCSNGISLSRNVDKNSMFS